MRIKNILSVACIVALALNGNALWAQNTSTFVTSFTPWERIPERDITTKKRVWRELDAKDNPLLFAPTANGNMSLAEVLITGIKDGHIKAYSPINDRFTDELSYEQLQAQINTYHIVNKTIDPLTGQELNECVDKAHILSAVHQYRIKEDWLTVKDKFGETVCILGIAPVISVTDENGITTEQPLFWVFYFGDREYLSRYLIPSDKKGQTWDEFFQARQFNSKVSRVVEDFMGYTRR